MKCLQHSSFILTKKNITTKSSFYLFIFFAICGADFYTRSCFPCWPGKAIMSLQHQCSPVDGASVLWKAPGFLSWGFSRVHFHSDAAFTQTFMVSLCYRCARCESDSDPCDYCFCPCRPLVLWRGTSVNRHAKENWHINGFHTSQHPLLFPPVKPNPVCFGRQV